MSHEISVVTPENIPLTLELAGLGSRFGALLLDTLLQGAAVVALLLIGFQALAAGGLIWTDITTVLGGWLVALLAIGIFLILFGYFILFETIWNGQTPGKRAMGLRVVRDEGYPITFFAATARNLIRIVDFLPVAYGIGSLTSFFQPHYKRLGDMVAGTVVIKERIPASLSSSPTSAAAPAPPTNVLLPAGVRHPSDFLSPEEIRLLRRFSLRRGQMTVEDAERFAYRLVVPLVDRLHISFAPGSRPDFASVVAALVAAVDAREAAAEEAF